MKTSLLAFVLCLLLPLAPAGAGQVVLGAFSRGDLTGWETRSFQGETQYELVMDQGRRVLRARSDNAASGLFKPVEVDLKRFPILSWSWKVSGVAPGGDARRKEGDDYPARIYVFFPSLLFWRTTGIAYIWANKLPLGAWTPNPFTSNIIMLAVDSGPGLAGRWVSRERDVLADYRRFFGRDPPEKCVAAIMTDSDNTGGTVEAYYGDIILKSR
jgi:hypothetical protein